MATQPFYRQPGYVSPRTIGEDNTYGSSFENLLGSPSMGHLVQSPKFGQYYLGRDIMNKGDFGTAINKAATSLAGQAPGTRDATGLLSVPTPDNDLLRNVIIGTALGGTAFGLAGGFGGASTAAPTVGGTVAPEAGVMAPSATTPGGVSAAYDPALGGGYWGPSVDGGVTTAAGGTSGLFDMTNKDWLKLAGGVVPAVLGYLGAGRQNDAYRDVANRNLALGAPYRNRLEQSYAPNFDLFSQPGYAKALERAADVATRQWSTRGNPAGNPTLQAGIYNDVNAGLVLPALANYRGQLGQFSGLGLNTSGLAQLGGANVAGNELDAIGYGAGRLLSPQPGIEDLLKQIQGINGPLVIGGVPMR